MDEHPVPDRKVLDPRAEVGDPSHGLVAEDPRAAIVAAKLLEVGPADTAGSERDDDLAGSRVGLGTVLESDRSAVREVRELHSRARAAVIAASKISIASSISSRRTMSGGM